VSKSILLAGGIDGSDKLYWRGDGIENVLPTKCLNARDVGVIRAQARGHSRKPDEFYEKVERVNPESRLDMFARETREGFKAWGNEVEKFERVETK